MLNIANEKGLESNANEYHKESFIIGKLSKYVIKDKILILIDSKINN